MEQWKQMTLGELCTLRAGSAFKTQYQGQSAGEIPFIKVSDMNLPENQICIREANHWVSEDVRAEIKAKTFPKGTTVFAKIGEALKQNRVRLLVRDTLIDNNMMGALPNRDVVDPDFFYYRLSEFDIASTATGTALPYLTVSTLVQSRFTIPPLSIQRRIAGILSAYDELIENNTRRIQVLERMAQALYREWFVHFRFPGHAQVKLVTSPLGKIPQGWAIRRLDEVASVNASTIRRGHEPENILYVDIASVTTGRIEKIEPMAFTDAPGRARRLVQHGDTIWSCVRPNRKSFSLILNPATDLIVSTGFAVLTPTKIPFSFLHQAVTTDDFVSYLTNNATGAAYPAVTAKDFEAAKMLLPDEPLLRLFHEECEPMLLLKENLMRKNSSLRRTRDLLLPRLLSGQVELKTEAA